MELILPAQAREAIVRHVVNELPEEGCGLLAGPAPGVVRMVYPLDNVQRSASAYTIDPTGHFRALQHAERNGWELNGAFHSHPSSPAVPSPTDLALAAEPDWVFVIVGLAGPHVAIRGFRLMGGGSREVAIREV